MNWRHVYFTLGLDLCHVTASLFAVWSQIGMIRSTHYEWIDYVLRKFRLANLDVYDCRTMDDVVVHKVFINNALKWGCGSLAAHNAIAFCFNGGCPLFKIQDNILYRDDKQVMESLWKNDLLDLFVDLIVVECRPLLGI